MGEEVTHLSLALLAIRSGLRQLEEEDGVISTDVAADLPEETETVEEAMRRVIRRVQQDEGMADALKLLATTYAERGTRFNTRAQRGRGLLLAAMDAMQWNTKELPEGTVSLRPGTAGVVITDEASLPPEYLRTTVAPDRAAIGKALKAGVEVSGAALANGMPVLTLRNK